MITKVIEREILDSAWLEITRLHPELLQNSDGEPLALKPNFALKNACTPSSVIEQPFLTTSLEETQGFLLMTTNNDACVMADPSTGGSIVQSLLLKQSDFEAFNLPATANPVKVCPLRIAALSSPIGADRVLRVVISSIVEIEEPLVPEGDAGGKKAPPPKKGAVAEPEPMKKVGKCRLAIVEIRLGALGKFRSPALIKMSVVAECLFALPSASLSELKSVDMSADTELLAVATSTGVSLYALPKVAERAGQDNNNSMDHITEIAEGEHEEEEEAKPIILEPCLVIDSTKVFEGKSIKHSLLSPLAPSLPSSTYQQQQPPPNTGLPVPANKGSKSVPSPFYRTGVSVIFEDKPEWILLGLKSGAAGHEVGSALISEPGQKVTATIISKWQLPSPVSSITTDEGKTVLVLGHCDGSLSMWNLATRTFTSIEGRHETAPTSLCILRSETSERKSEFNYFLISGALDGTLCFFTINFPRTIADSFLASLNESSSNGAPCISASFTAFRFDVDPGCSIASIRSLRNLPLAVVQCSNGLSCIYDLQGGKLLGRFVLYSGIMSKQISWHVATLKELSQASLVPIEETGTEASTAPTSRPSTAAAAAATENTKPDERSTTTILKRASKYSISSESDVHSVEGFDSVSTASSSGFHSIYFRDQAPVLATFKIEDIFLTFFPGLVSVCGNSSNDVARMTQVFNVLSSAERLDSKLASLRLSQLDGVGGGGAIDLSALIGGSSSTSASANKRLGTGGDRASKTPVGSRRNSETQKSQPGSRRNSDSQKHRGSKAGLDGGFLEASMIGGAVKVSSDAESISKLTWDRVKEPGQVVASSVSKSASERGSRKLRVANQLGAFSTLF